MAKRTLKKIVLLKSIKRLELQILNIGLFADYKLFLKWYDERLFIKKIGKIGEYPKINFYLKLVDQCKNSKFDDFLFLEFISFYQNKKKQSFFYGSRI